MSLLSKLSQASFSLLRFLDETVSLPEKVSRSLDFRNSWREFLEENQGSTGHKPTLWIHGASVGELEDLANYFLNEELVRESGYELSSLVVTSSSASAAAFLEKLRKRFSFRYAGPLPPESPQALKRFFEALQPELLLLSHSDLWPLCMELAQRNYLNKGIIWLPSRRFASQTLLRHVFAASKLKHVGVRNDADMQSLKNRLANESMHPKFYTLGNPRLDRIFERIQTQKTQASHVLEQYGCAPNPEKRSLIVGSAWLEDAQCLSRCFSELSSDEQQQWQVVVLPHETSNMHLVASIQNQLPFAKILSLQGYLLEAYQGFDLAFVGGGFRTGLHNVLEPLSWGIPTLCGPDLKQQPDAPYWVEQGALRTITSAQQMAEALRETPEETSAKIWQEKADEASKMIQERLGASARLSQLVKEASLRA